MKYFFFSCSLESSICLTSPFIKTIPSCFSALLPYFCQVSQLPWQQSALWRSLWFCRSQSALAAWEQWIHWQDISVPSVAFLLDLVGNLPQVPVFFTFFFCTQIHVINPDLIVPEQCSSSLCGCNSGQQGAVNPELDEFQQSLKGWGSTPWASVKPPSNSKFDWKAGLSTRLHLYSDLQPGWFFFKYVHIPMKRIHLFNTFYWK